MQKESTEDPTLLYKSWKTAKNGIKNLLIAIHQLYLISRYQVYNTHPCILHRLQKEILERIKYNIISPFYITYVNKADENKIRYLVETYKLT